jgi:hypothetical protein
MSQFIYNWTRFWCLRDGGYHIDGNGFLVRSEYFKDTFEFASIADIPCLILLGEPGIGKSYAVGDAVRLVSKSCGKDRCFPLDLRSYGSEDRLYDALFKSEEVRHWLDGDYRLHVFLDSFDECLLRIDNIATLLEDELKTGRYPIDRLLFRIASRTAEFPHSLEKALQEIWGAEEKVKAYELCPLQTSDVWEAATVNAVSPKDFFAEIHAKNAGTLAARPITLRLLLNLFSKSNHLPDRLTDLYEQGCRVLCDEQNEDRRTSTRLRGALSADQKLIIAARIAAVMVFCNKAAVWKEAEVGEYEEADVLLRDLSGYNEASHNVPLDVTEERIRETLFNTGLFTARGPHRMGWAHQSFAEFLAAWYVSRHNLETEQLLSLITQPSDLQRPVTLQLQETAAWLASLRADIFNEILIRDPVLLLRSDVASFSTEMRAKLVSELLNVFAEEKASDWGLNYQRLKHPNLASQLLPVIKDKGANYLARRFAIDVAEACQLQGLQNDLAALILDQTEPDYVRANAGYALWRVGDAETRKRIKHLAINGSPNDQDERVRGIALLCNWNDNMTAEEAFASLVHSPNLHDSYSLFLGHFTEKLGVEDLPVALRWIKDNGSEFEGDYSVGRVIDEVMLLAWRHLETPEVVGLFAEASLVRLRSFEHDVIDLSNIDRPERFTEELSDRQKRRAAFKAIVPLVDEDKHDSFFVSDSRILQPRKEDLPWLLEQLNEATSEEKQKPWLQFLGRFYSGWEVDPDAFTILYEAYEDNNTAVRKYYSWVFTVVGLDTTEASQQREAHERLIAPRKQREERLKEEVLNPSPRQRLLSSLEKLENGDMDSWWRLNLELPLRPFGNRQYLDELQFDLTKLPGWQEADGPTRKRIVDAAKRYVVDGQPGNDEWVGTNIVFRPAFAGYRALYLLLAESAAFVEELSDDLWAKWAAIIVSYPLNSFGGDEVIPHQQLVERAYRAAPDEVIKTVLKLIDGANQKDESFYFPQRLEVCWDGRFKNALHNKLIDGTLKTKTWGQLLEDLVTRKDIATRSVTQSALSLFIDGQCERERALCAAASLMRHAEGNDWWPFVWNAIKKDAVFGRTLIERVCDQARPASRFSDDDATEFFFWLVKAFPPDEDPELPTGHAFAVTPRMEITTFRDSFLHELKQRGTSESLSALEKIAAASSQLEKKLHWILIEARNNVRRHTWQPLTPAALLALLKKPHPLKKQTVTFWKRVHQWLQKLKWAFVPAAIIMAGLGEYAIGIALSIGAVVPFTLQICEWPGFGERKWLVRVVKALWLVGVAAMLIFFVTVFYKMKASKPWSNLLPTSQQNVEPR